MIDHRPIEGTHRTVAGVVFVVVVLAMVLVVFAVFTGGGGVPGEIPPRGEPGATGHFSVDAVEVDEQVWRTAPIRGTVAYQELGATVAVGSTMVAVADAGLVGLDVADGSLRWRRPLGWELDGVATVSGLVLTFAGGGLVAVDPVDGEVVWRSGIDGWALRLVAASGSTPVVIAGADEDGAGGRLVALDATDGTPVWSAAIEDGSDLAPWPPPAGPQSVTTGDVAVVRVGHSVTVEERMPDGTVKTFPVFEPGPLVAVDLHTGEERWRVSQSRPGHYVAQGGLVVATDDDETSDGRAVVAHDAATGEIRWRTGGMAGVEAIVATADAVYVSTRHGLVVLDHEHGREVDRIPQPSPFFDVRQAGQRLVIDTGDMLSLLDPASGETLLELERDGRSLGLGAVTDEVVYVATEQGITAVDLVSGDERWSFSGRAVGGCELLRFGGELVVTSAGNIFTLDPATGTLGVELTHPPRRLDQTSRVPRERVSSAILVDVDTDPAEAAASDPRLITAVGPARHRAPTVVRAWAAALDEPVWETELPRVGPALVGGERLAVLGGSAPHRDVTAIEATDGEERWHRSLLPPDQLTPRHGRALVAAAERIIIGGDDGLRAWSLIDGQELWRAPLKLGPAAISAVAREDVLLADTGDQMLALNPTDGTIRWEYERTQERSLWTGYPGTLLPFGERRPEPALVGELALVPDGDRLVALDIASGQPYWTTTLHTPTIAGLSVAGQRIYVATAEGIEVLDLTTGDRSSHDATDRLVVSAPFLDGVRLYVCLADGTVAAYE